MPNIDNTLETGTSALKASTKTLGVIGNNIANLATVAFKGQNLYQTDSFSQTLRQSASSPSSGNASNVAASQVGSGTRVGSIERNYDQGTLENSSSAAHLAVDGKGWFQVVDPSNSEKYATRDGTFRTDDNGYFTSKDGLRLQGSVHDPAAEPTYTVTYVNNELVFTKDTPPAAGASSISNLSISYTLSVGSGLTRDAGVPGSITDAQIAASAPRLSSYSFNDQGELQIQLSDGVEFVRGQVLLMTFKDEQGLMSESGGLFSGFGAAGQETFSIDASKPGQAGLGKIRQRMLEGSNVDLTEEFAKIISAQKTLQAAARIITTSDRVLEEVVNLKR